MQGQATMKSKLVHSCLGELKSGVEVLANACQPPAPCAVKITYDNVPQQSLLSSILNYISKPSMSQSPINSVTSYFCSTCTAHSPHRCTRYCIMNGTGSMYSIISYLKLACASTTSEEGVLLAASLRVYGVRGYAVCMSVFREAFYVRTRYLIGVLYSNVVRTHIPIRSVFGRGQKA